MGNHHSTGHFFNLCGCTDVIGFEGSAKAVINMYEIKPWNARSLIRDNLNKQGDLARKSPLRKVPIMDGLEYFQKQIRSSMFGSRELTKDRFVEIAVMLLGQQNIPHNPREREDLYQIFDSMDFDKNGTLSTGEWAAGLSVFFKGSMEEAVRAVFRCLDANENGAISKSELQVYLSPFVKAMSPPEAAALRPILEKKAVDDIYYDMDMDHQSDISSDEMLAWSRRGNNIIDRLADIIDQEVYQLWLAESKRKNQNRRYSDPSSASPAGSSPGSGRYEAMPMDYQEPGYGQRASMSSMGPGPAQPGYEHSEYGPGPYQQPNTGYSGNFQSSYASPPAYSSQSPQYSQYGGGMAQDARAPPPDLHDPFAQPRAGAMPPPPPPPAPGRGAPPGYAGGGCAPTQAYSAYSSAPCQSSSPQYRGRY
ncbi:Guca1a [Symbiodinium natans]|uniref:Guca1a protein n=1 Tax=Symbiodinium natans TaxID=878477 RepID=A0A812RGA0_9DINO|nr:Guca1a [Symbiodinium natans]